jgi:hypothetical protein
MKWKAELKPKQVAHDCPTRLSRDTSPSQEIIKGKSGRQTAEHVRKSDGLPEKYIAKYPGNTLYKDRLLLRCRGCNGKTVECISSSVKQHLNTATHKLCMSQHQEQEEEDARLKGDLVQLYTLCTDFVHVQSHLTCKLKLARNMRATLDMREICARPRNMRKYAAPRFGPKYAKNMRA